MDSVAGRKYHVAPLRRQQREVEKLLKAGRFRNISEFIRGAIDHYLDALGRPSLSKQARQMGEDWERQHPRRPEAERHQAASMDSEGW